MLELNSNLVEMHAWLNCQTSKSLKRQALERGVNEAGKEKQISPHLKKIKEWPKFY